MRRSKKNMRITLNTDTMKKQEKAKMLSDIISGTITIKDAIPDLPIVFMQIDNTGTWQTDDVKGKLQPVPGNDIEKYVSDYLQPLHQYKKIVPVMLPFDEYERLYEKILSEI